MFCQQTGVHHALNPDPYRGAFGSDGKKYARDVQDIIDFGTSGSVAGFITEAIQGVGGVIELAPGYLPDAYNFVRKAGGLCIADEVQAGFARIGSHFWGFESHGVVPDIVTMAKGIGNGIPVGAVVTTPEIAKVLTYSNYFNTFGGNPVCTAGGLAVLRVIERENLQQNAHEVGSYLKKRLTSLKEKYEIVGDVRGRGFFLGVELITDHKLKTPAKVETLHVMEQMKEMGVLIGKGGFYSNVMRITPPLCFTKENAANPLVTLPASLQSTSLSLRRFSPMPITTSIPNIAVTNTPQSPVKPLQFLVHLPQPPSSDSGSQSPSVFNTPSLAPPADRSTFLHLEQIPYLPQTLPSTHPKPATEPLGSPVSQTQPQPQSIALKSSSSFPPPQALIKTQTQPLVPSFHHSPYKLECLYAIKVVHREALAYGKKLQRADMEKEILGSLDHPFLPTLYTEFYATHYSRLVMKLCPAVTSTQPGNASQGSSSVVHQPSSMGPSVRPVSN
ncbi:hypothetical protein NE237_004276 [Protea cynaroides]|uniref:Uncharacterized protein n=1 Tax=Protea cynaroides TaxID=273540 RepID=A0A9Q0KIK0_9MAGN|nr:hypothetical protein NE237_004276 [Protea cynaroides]